MRFKKRDKVLVYGGITRDPKDSLASDCPLAYLRGKEAKVTNVIDIDTEITVKFNDGYETEVHPMQCRKCNK